MKYKIQHHKDQDSDHINVHWDSLTICQLKCSYCYARNEYGKEWGKISDRTTIDAVLDALNRSSLNFNLGLLGGEPTLGPHYYYILDSISKMEKFNWVYVVTNGEKDLTTHPHYDRLAFLFSYHPADCTDRDRFLKNVQHMLDRGYKCKVNVMLHHDKNLWPKIKEMFETLEKIPNLKVHPHFLYGNSISKLFNYRKDFWEYFSFLESYEKELKYDDDLFNDYIIFRDKMTNFKGWSCYNNNYEIDVKGNVVKFCMPKTDNINLVRDRDFFKNINKTIPMICPHKACNCDGLLKQLKIKNE
jgi:sulfatase maturation enzyme AslB (radical SAM superfamily)